MDQATETKSNVLLLPYFLCFYF